MNAEQMMHAALTKMAADGNVEAAFTLELVKQMAKERSNDDVISVLHTAHKELTELNIGMPGRYTIQRVQSQIVTAIGML